MKTVRFTEVVAHSGKPHAHAFWVEPEHDREFLAAQKANRVMTVAPLEPGKADVGTIGFDKARAKSGQVLLFPKSLRAFEGAHVVGVKFDQVEQPPLVAGEQETPKPARHRTASPAIPAAAPPTPATHEGRTRHGPPTPERRPARGGGNAEHRRGNAKSATTPATGRAHAHRPKESEHASDKDADLRGEVLAAIKELQAGKAVAAYERLHRAIKR